MPPAKIVTPTGIQKLVAAIIIGTTPTAVVAVVCSASVQVSLVTGSRGNTVRACSGSHMN